MKKPGPKPNMVKREVIKNLRDKGFSYRRIAKELGKSPSTIYYMDTTHDVRELSTGGS